jgi:hypothetical protein
LSSNGRSLWESITAAGIPTRRLHGLGTVISLADLARASSRGGRLEELRQRTVLLATKSQLVAALAMLELDGVARRLVLCPPDLAPEHLPGVIAGAGADACVRDAAGPAADAIPLPICITAQPQLLPGDVSRRGSQTTEWILLTSGTTGAPRLVLHDLASLTSAFAGEAASTGIVWGTFYDIRRYGGLQIFLRAVHVGSLLLSEPTESVSDFLARVATAGITHISGTQSHWHKALMSGAAAGLVSPPPSSARPHRPWR